MNFSKTVLPTLLVCALPAFARAAPAEAAQGGPSLDMPACEAVARAARKAARHEAQSDFWLAVGTLVNEVPADLPTAMRDAWIEREATLSLAQAQYELRLETCAALGHGPYEPRIDPVEFSASPNNPYFPLVPGRTLVYERHGSAGLERIEVTTLDHTQEIAGVECRVVDVVETLDGVLVEHTTDWYAQHANGDVWYFGEIARQYEDGILDNLDGSWRTGKEGALPGIVMMRSPVLNQAYRQEYWLNEAEDMARVVSTSETVTVPLGTFDNCLQTEEWDSTEPDDQAIKYYAPGFGFIMEQDLETGERLELVQIK